MSRAAQIEAAVAEWVRRREEEDWSVADQADLDAWLDESMAHKVAYWRFDHGWQMAGRISALRSSPPVGGRPARSGMWWRYGLLAASLCLVALVGAAWFYRPAPDPVAIAQFDTQVGGHRIVSLPDGSRIELNTGTKIRTEISGRMRDVWLDRGEAYFEVAHIEGSRFVVHAGSHVVTVLGTKFSVRRDGEEIRVAVVQGRVRIDDREQAAATASAVVTRGDIAIARGQSTLVSPRSVERVEGDLAWREGRLVFDRTTLADAAAEFNLYNHTRITIADPAVAAIRIGGTFQSGNTEAFVRLLEDAYGLKVARNGENVTISD